MLVNRGTIAGLAAAGLAATFAAAAYASPASAAAAAPAAAAAQTAISPFTAAAGSALLHVTALSSVPLADLVLGPAVAATDSSKATGSSTAEAANLDALALGTLSLNGILTDVSQSSTPGSNAAPATKTLLAVPAAPVATAGVGTGTASATDASGSACPAANTPISSGNSQVAGASVLPAAAVGDGVDINQTVNSVGSTLLTQVPGQTGLGVSSVATSSLTELTLLGGTVAVSVSHVPSLTVVATGTPGTSSVTYSAPIVTVTIAGTSQTLSAPGQTIAIPGLGSLSLGSVTQTVSPDGTSVTASTSLVHLDISPAGTQVLSVDIAPETATATAPAGGVFCAASTGTPVVAPPNPFSEFTKGLSAASVNAGDTFDTPLILSNHSSCTVTDAKVTDVVKGDVTLVASNPKPSAQGGGTYTYGPFTLAPGQVIVVSQTFKVPADEPGGTKYGDTATVTGTCDGIAETGTGTRTGPVVDAPGTGACDLRRSDLTSDHRQVSAGEEFDDITNLFNVGNADCTNVVVTEKIPAGTTFVSCTGGCTHSGDTVTWKVGTIKPGQSKTLTLTLLAPDGPLDGHPLTSTSVVTSNGPTVNLRTDLPKLTGTSVLNPLEAPTRGPRVEPVTDTKPTQPSTTLAYTGLPGITWPALLVLAVAGLLGFLRRRDLRQR